MFVKCYLKYIQIQNMSNKNVNRSPTKELKNIQYRKMSFPSKNVLVITIKNIKPTEK